MKKILFFVLTAKSVLTFVSVDRAQETPQHAPTVQTCRADVSLWYSEEMDQRETASWGSVGKVSSERSGTRRSPADPT